MVKPSDRQQHSNKKYAPLSYNPSLNSQGEKGDREVHET